MKHNSIRKMENFDNKLINACSVGNAALVKEFIATHWEKEDYAVVDNLGYSALHRAVDGNSLQCVRLLLETNLIDIGQKTSLGHTCLQLAVFEGVSCDIIRLLLKYDTEFRSIGCDFKALGYAVYKKSYPMVSAIIDTLQEMKFPFCNVLDALKDGIRSLKFNYDERSNSMEIFKKLMNAMVDETAEDFMQTVSDAVSANTSKFNDCIFYWCVHKWHLREDNEHRELVRLLVEDPEYRFNYPVIFGLHSGIRRYKVNVNLFAYRGAVIHVHILKDQIDRVEREVCYKVVKVLRPKVTMQCMFYNACSHLFDKIAATRSRIPLYTKSPSPVPTSITYNIDSWNKVVE